MRILATASALALLTTASSGALARGKTKRTAPQSDARVAYVDDEPMSRHAARSDDNGTLRTIDFQASGPADVHNGAQPDERGVANDPMAGRARPLSGAMEELAHRQMRKHQKSIDACTQASKGQGTITLNLVVGERTVAKAEIADDQIHDAALSQCLVSAAQKWTFSLSHASFQWSVALGKLSQR